jgi:hypothetical protein
MKIAMAEARTDSVPTDRRSGHMLAPLVVGIVLGVPMLVVSMGRRRLRRRLGGA